MCRTCRKPCDNIIQHIRKENGFSESYIKDSLKSNSNSYKNSFEKIGELKSEFSTLRFGLIRPTHSKLIEN